MADTPVIDPLDKLHALVGNFKKIFIEGCSGDPSIWLEVDELLALASEVAPEVAWEIAVPDDKELYKHIAGESVLCDFKKNFKTAVNNKGIANSDYTRATFHSLGLLDQKLWYAFLYSATENALLRYTSQMIKGQCMGPGKSPYYGSGDHWFGGLDKDGRWQTADFTMNPESVYAPVTTSKIIVKPNFEGWIAAHAQWTRAHDDTIGIVSSRVYNVTHDTVFNVDKQIVAVGPTTNTVNFLPVFYKNTDSRDVEIRVEWSFDGEQHEAGTAMILSGGYCSLYAVK